MRKKATYIDGDKDVHLPLTNCTAFLCKKKRNLYRLQHACIIMFVAYLIVAVLA